MWMKYENCWEIRQFYINKKLIKQVMENVFQQLWEKMMAVRSYVQLVMPLMSKSQKLAKYYRSVVSHGSNNCNSSRWRPLWL
jgi:hypothetical protein